MKRIRIKTSVVPQKTELNVSRESKKIWIAKMLKSYNVIKIQNHNITVNQYYTFEKFIDKTNELMTRMFVCSCIYSITKNKDLLKEFQKCKNKLEQILFNNFNYYKMVSNDK